MGKAFKISCYSFLCYSLYSCPNLACHAVSACFWCHWVWTNLRRSKGIRDTSPSLHLQAEAVKMRSVKTTQLFRCLLQEALQKQSPSGKKRTKKKDFKTRLTSHGKSEFLVFNQNNTFSPLHPPLRVCFFTLSLVRVCQCVLHLIPLMTVPPTGRVRGQSTTHIEGTGTRPDYLVDRDDTNMEGPFGNNTEIEK